MDSYYRLRRKQARDRVFFRRQKIYGLFVALFGVGVVALGELWNWPNFQFVGDVLVIFGLYTAITQNRLLSH